MRRGVESVRSLLIFIAVLILTFVLIWLLAGRQVDPTKIASLRDTFAPFIDKLKGGG
jgi:hypothetical protein